MEKFDVLVVEDNNATASLLCMLLESAGFTPHATSLGMEAATLISLHSPDLVLLDLNLPDIDGWELCAMIRSLPDPALAATPIIMVSARAAANDRLKGLTVGADDYIVKPFSPEEVAIRAKKLIDKTRAQKEIQRERLPEQESARDLAAVQAMFFHDLRSHMTTVGGFSRRIIKEAEELNNPRLMQYADSIYRSSQYLQDFADDIMVFSAIEENGIDESLESVEPNDSLLSVLNIFRPIAEEKGISLIAELAEPAPRILFRESVLKICFSNLLHNAIKYSPKGSTVTVRSETAEDGFLLTVADNGPGIPASELPKIFRKFYRGAEAEKKSKGTGLGLYIVESLARKLGAKVLVESVEGVGSAFRITFNLAGPTDS